jgi:hypothetical protein
MKIKCGMSAVVLNRALMIVGGLLLPAFLASAAPIATLFNTGVNNDGSLAAGGSVDQHYTLTLSADPAFPGPSAFVADPIAAPFWVNTPTSQYIAPQANQAFPGTMHPTGNYNYRTTFDLTGFDPASASITGIWRTDDIGLNIFINDTSTGQTAPLAHTDTPFAISSGFVAGLNTLDFLIDNSGGGPTGIRINVSGNADLAQQVAEPATLLLVGFGLLGLAGFAGKRRRRT